MEALPAFRYHPDPVATGSVVRSDDPCACCGRARGYVYVASIHGRERPAGPLCPWCIASGDASRRFDVEFSDPHGVPTQAADEIARRTPGFTGWQQEQWLSCCGDACEYYGDAPETEVRSLSAEDVMRIATETGYPADFVASFVRTYEVGGNPCLHKFVCRHCRAAHYAIDGT